MFTKRFSELQSGRLCVIFCFIQSNLFLTMGFHHANKHRINPDSIVTAVTLYFPVRAVQTFQSGVIYHFVMLNNGLLIASHPVTAKFHYM